METAIYTLLNGDAAVAALVDTRIYPLVCPEDKAALPHITYQRISTQPNNSKTGPMNLDYARLQIDCWSGRPTSGRYASAKEIADAVRTVLDGYHGTVGLWRFDHIFPQNILDLTESPAFAEEHGETRVMLDFEVVYKAAA